MARDSEVTDMDDAVMAMESDFVPDPQQYQAHSSADVRSSSSSSPQTEYCNQYCGYVWADSPLTTTGSHTPCRMPLLCKYAKTLQSGVK